MNFDFHESARRSMQTKRSSRSGRQEAPRIVKPLPAMAKGRTAYGGCMRCSVSEARKTLRNRAAPLGVLTKRRRMVVARATPTDAAGANLHKQEPGHRQSSCSPIHREEGDWSGGTAAATSRLGRSGLSPSLAPGRPRKDGPRRFDGAPSELGRHERTNRTLVQLGHPARSIATPSRTACASSRRKTTRTIAGNPKCPFVTHGDGRLWTTTADICAPSRKRKQRARLRHASFLLCGARMTAPRNPVIST